MNYPIAPSVPDLCSENMSNQELSLSEFIKFAFQQSRSGHYPDDVVMQLLDRAWEAQKLLWQLRSQRLSNESKDFSILDVDRELLKS